MKNSRIKKIALEAAVATYKAIMKTAFDPTVPVGVGGERAALPFENPYGREAPPQPGAARQPTKPKQEESVVDTTKVHGTIKNAVLNILKTQVTNSELTIDDKDILGPADPVDTNRTTYIKDKNGKSINKSIVQFILSLHPTYLNGQKANAIRDALDNKKINQALKQAGVNIFSITVGTVSGTYDLDKGTWENGEGKSPFYGATTKRVL